MRNNDAWQGLAAHSAAQHGVFNRTQAAEFGVDAQRLRRAVKAGRVVALLSDVFAFTAAPATWHRTLMAATLAGAVISHRCAAAMHRLDGFSRTTDPVDVCFPRGSHRDLGALGQIVGHTWSFTNKDDITVIDGIRVTSVARTLVQLGSVCTADQVEVALDCALRNGASPQWIEATADRLRRHGPWGGDVLVDIMYDPRRSGALSESVLEKLVERVLRNGGLPAPQRQYQVATSAGTKRLDLAFPEARLGVEGHSRRHHFGYTPELADAERDLALAAEGWEILYVTWAMANQPAFFIELLKRTYQQRVKLIRAS